MAWILIGLLAAFNGLALLSIGPYILPVTGLLVALAVVGAARRPRPAPASDCNQ